MAREESLINISLPVAADYSTKQYFLVAVDGNGRAALAGAGAQADGVLQNKPDAIDAAGTIAISGVTHAECGGTITTGALVAADSAGKFVAAASGDNIVGVALGAGASGRIISVLLKLQNANAIA